MDYRVIGKSGRNYIRLNPTGHLIMMESDALELLSACAENSTNLLLIPGERLSDEFFRLGTGLAGSILQKFALYGIKFAVLLDQDAEQGRFREFLIESNRGNAFRSFSNVEEAESWLLNQ